MFTMDTFFYCSQLLPIVTTLDHTHFVYIYSLFVHFSPLSLTLKYKNVHLFYHFAQGLSNCYHFMYILNTFILFLGPHLYPLLAICHLSSLYKFCPFPHFSLAFVTFSLYMLFLWTLCVILVAFNLFHHLPTFYPCFIYNYFVHSVPQLSIFTYLTILALIYISLPHLPLIDSVYSYFDKLTTI